MARPEKRKLERVQYWQGQMLKSRDFRDIQAVAAQRRWWHNRSIHNAYGIYKGWHASLTAGSLAVKVCPGVAYDCFGRELLLPSEQQVPLPATPLPENEKTQYLLVRYRESRNSCGDERQGQCWVPSDRGLLDTVEFIWKRKDSVSPMDGVVIASLVASPDTSTSQFRLDDSFEPFAAQPLASPLLVSGSTVPGNTAWELWTTIEISPLPGDHMRTIGVQTFIDTSSAGFTDIPIYFAWLEGPLWNPQTEQLVPALLPSIAQEGSASFTFHLWLPVSPRGFETSPPKTAPDLRLVDALGFSAFAQQQNLYVSWIGCQCLAACRTVGKPKTAPIDVKP